MEDNKKAIKNPAFFDSFVIILKGFFVGGSMLVPGVSGSSMAIILGIYDRTISALSSFFKDVKKNSLFLFLFVLGWTAGFFLGVRPIRYLLSYYPLPTGFFFLGAVAGGSPMIFKKAKVKKFSFKIILYILIGSSFVYLLSMIPNNFLSNEGSGLVWFSTQFIAGLILSVALILPGISTTHMLMVMGLYDKVTLSIEQFNFLHLIPLGIGTLIGIVIVAKLVEKALKKYTQATYLIVFGFIIASLFELFPAMQFNWWLVVELLMFMLGFICVYLISKFDSSQ